MTDFLRSRLTYANVIATLALFVALGGTAYAAVQINGSQIVNRSIAGQKLKLHTVTSSEIDPTGLTVPYATRAGNVSHLIVSRSSASKKGAASRAPASNAAQAVAVGSLVTLAVGTSTTVIQSSPFTVTATCTDTGGGAYELELDATSSTNGWYDVADQYVDVDNSGPFAANQIVGLTRIVNTGPSQELTSAGGYFLIAASGASLSIPSFPVMVHTLGDCAFTMYGID
jgi:hypothetical protein